jgi:hypothetical protein
MRALARKHVGKVPGARIGITIGLLAWLVYFLYIRSFFNHSKVEPVAPQISDLYPNAEHDESLRSSLAQLQEELGLARESGDEPSYIDSMDRDYTKPKPEEAKMEESDETAEAVQVFIQ